MVCGTVNRKLVNGVAEAVETAGELAKLFTNRVETITTIPSASGAGINIKTQHILTRQAAVNAL